MTCWVTLDDTLGNAQALVDTLSDAILEMEGITVGDSQGGVQALVDEMADTLAEVEAVTPGDTLGDRYALNDLLGVSRRHMGRCGATGRGTGRHTIRGGGADNWRHTGRHAE